MQGELEREMASEVDEQTLVAVTNRFGCGDDVSAGDVAPGPGVAARGWILRANRPANCTGGTATRPSEAH